MRKWLCAWLLASSAAPALAAEPQRVVTLGGSVTEIVYALGQEQRLVGDDLSSLYPEAATRLPRVGYYRAVPVEGVVALGPDLVLASEQAGPPLALERLRALGVNVRVVSDAHRVESLYTRVTQIAEALGVEAAGREMVARLRRQMAEAEAIPSTGMKTLLLVNRTGNSQGAGSDTAAQVVMEMAGLSNVLASEHGYRPISAEGLAALAPSMIIVTASSMQALGGMDAFLRSPGVAGTPAAREHRIVVMDDLLVLGLGPRLPQAVRQLKQAAGASPQAGAVPAAPRTASRSAVPFHQAWTFR
jgi:iron complex transport system substrate-binding protein